VVACGLDGRTGELFERRLTPDHDELAGWLQGLPGPVEVVYEVGPTGFGLARALTGRGIMCWVAAPSRLQRPSGDRIKTDRRDARHLARLLHLDQIVAVAVPSVGQEAARDLVRAREDVRQDLSAARHRLSKLLLRQGIVYYGGAPWTGAHDRWLRSRRRDPLFTSPGLGLAFDIAYDTMLATVARRDRLDDAIAELAADSEFTPVVTRLGCLRGVSTLTAFGLAVEIGDWQRLTGRSIGAYLGLGPHRVLLRGIAVAGVDHEDRQRARPPPADRSRVASPPPEPAQRGRAPPPGPCQCRGTGPGRAGEPAAACPLGAVRCPPQAPGRGEHCDRPRARRLVLVTRRPRRLSDPLIVRKRVLVLTTAPVSGPARAL
jgi:transposase